MGQTHSQGTEETSKLLSTKSCKVAVVGDAGSGKTSLIIRFCCNRFPLVSELEKSTLDTEEVTIDRRGKKFNLTIFDTSGHEDYARLRALTYNACDVIILCVALDSPTALGNVIKDWNRELSYLAYRKPVILVGTKRDFRGRDQEVTRHLSSIKQGKTIAKRIGAVKYFECSALDEPRDKRVMRVFGRALREGRGDTGCCPCW